MAATLTPPGNAFTLLASAPDVADLGVEMASAPQSPTSAPPRWQAPLGASGGPWGLVLSWPACQHAITVDAIEAQFGTPELGAARCSINAAAAAGPQQRAPHGTARPPACAPSAAVGGTELSPPPRGHAPIVRALQRATTSIERLRRAAPAPATDVGIPESDDDYQVPLSPDAAHRAFAEQSPVPFKHRLAARGSPATVTQALAKDRRQDNAAQSVPPRKSPPPLHRGTSHSTMHAAQASLTSPFPFALLPDDGDAPDATTPANGLTQPPYNTGQALRRGAGGASISAGRASTRARLDARDRRQGSSDGSTDCSLCDKRFALMVGFLNHVRSKHPKEKLAPSQLKELSYQHKASRGVLHSNRRGCHKCKPLPELQPASVPGAAPRAASGSQPAPAQASACQSGRAPPGIGSPTRAAAARPPGSGRGHGRNLAGGGRGGSVRRATVQPAMVTQRQRRVASVCLRRQCRAGRDGMRSHAGMWRTSSTA